MSPSQCGQANRGHSLYLWRWILQDWVWPVQHGLHTWGFSTKYWDFISIFVILCTNYALSIWFLGPPSAPRNAISNVNETSVFLEWSIPLETGGRKDIRYNILCRQVLPEGRGLDECGPNVRFLPRRVGLSNTSVMVADLQSHTNYSFLLEAVNGVSELAKDHPKQYVSLNVTTNQAGMLHQTNPASFPVTINLFSMYIKDVVNPKDCSRRITCISSNVLMQNYYECSN